MPRSAPATPSKPTHLRGTFAKPRAPKADGRHGVKVPVPPRTRERNAEDPDEQKTEDNDEAYQEAPEEQSREEKSKDGSDDVLKIDGIVVPMPEQIAMPPSETQPPKKKRPRAHPQKSISKLWKNFDPEYLGRVTKILPDTPSTLLTGTSSVQQSQNAAESYRSARAACEETVDKIINECTAMNQKYTDLHFDLERDLKITRKRDCIDGLIQDPNDRDDPSDVKRVTVRIPKPVLDIR